MNTEEELKEIEQRCNAAQQAPWKACIEGRDHECGSDFIMTGEGTSRGNDIEMLGATEEDCDFVANARHDIPQLIMEIRMLKRSADVKK